MNEYSGLGQEPAAVPIPIPPPSRSGRIDAGWAFVIGYVVLAGAVGAGAAVLLGKSAWKGAVAGPVVGIGIGVAEYAVSKVIGT